MSQEPTAQPQPPFDVPGVDEMGVLLPQYEFEKIAAFGGMGAVYRARQLSLDRPVAIKILPPEFGRQEGFAERFKSEARAMAKLSHTHIVAVHDFGITRAGHLYLVMEWVEGQTLHALIHQGSIPVRKAANLAMQLCDALAYAHHHNVLHRDIKPGNIMVSEDEQVKVTDFGLARPITGEAEENPYGTPDYAAPEILNKGVVDQRADIFAAGVVLYEMLTGRVPQQPRRPVQEFAPLSASWDELIDKATHADPAQRFQDVGELRAHIAMLINQAAKAADGAAEGGAVIGAVLKQRRLLWATGAVAAAGLVLGLMHRGGQAPEAREVVKTPAKAAEHTAPKEESAGQARASAPVEKGEKKTAAVAPVETKATAAEPETQPPGAVPQDKSMTAKVPAPAPAAPSNPPPAPMAATPSASRAEPPQEMIQRLEERDPELARLVEAFGLEWFANREIDVEAGMRTLADKYVPALQRSLNGLAAPQRDFVLSEISHIANHEPLDEPDVSWPPVLKVLRKTYEEQAEALQAAAADAARKMRVAQCELVLNKASERAAAGRADEARRAEIVAAELAKLNVPPSLRALKQAAGR